MPDNFTRRVASAAALMALAVAPLAVTESAQASQAAPTQLFPSGNVSSNTPTLSWSRPSGAVKFDVQVDNSDDFGSPGFTTSTTNTRVVPTALLSGGDQYLRVRAISSSGSASTWSSTTFTIAELAAPAPISPTAGDVLHQPEDPPLLVWDGTQGATEYTVQVDKEGDWVDAFEYKTQTTSLVVPDPLEATIGAAGTTYSWRVKAKKATGVESNWSDEASFAVTALDPVTIVGPDDSPDNEIEDVELDWDPVPGAQYYQLRVATNQDFTNVVETRTNIRGTRYSPPVTYNNNQYYWQVRAFDLSNNPTDWSDVQNNFSRVWPDTPAAVFPADPTLETVSRDPYFQWTPVQHATQYELQVGSDPNFSPDTYRVCHTAGTTYTPYLGAVSESGSGTFTVRSHEICAPNPGTVTYWRVRPLDRPQSGTPAYVLGLFSETQSFIYNPAVGTTVTPASGSTVTDGIPTLSWDPILGAQSYRVEIEDRFGSSVGGDTTYTTSYTPLNRKLDPAKGPFHWFLTAYNANQKPISLILENTFHLTGSFPTTTAPALTPLSGRATDPATHLPPALSWEPMAGADSYRVFAGPAGTNTLFEEYSGDGLNERLYYPRLSDIWTWFLKPGSYDWRVQAYDVSGQVIGVGPTATLTIAPIPAVQGTRIALDGEALDNNQACESRIAAGSPDCPDVPTTPVFDWEPVPGAGAYMLYLSEDSKFTNLVEPLTSVPATSNTRWAPTLSSFRAALPETQAGDAYYWFVRPCRTTKICAASPVSQSGKATNRFRKRSPGVETVSPGAPLPTTTAPEVATTEVTFDWNDYFDTNQATTWASTGEKSPQAAMQYRIQVNTSPTFSMTSGQNLDDALVDQSTYTAFTKLYPEGQLYWRVQSIDAEGNGLSWSETRTFVKKSPAVQLKFPAEGSVGSGTRAFEWESQPFAGAYQVEVSKNNDRNFSSTNRLFLTSTSSKSVKQTAYSWNLPIPASTQPYWWRVRRIDASGNLGAWSTPRSFRSTGAVPSQMSPPAGSQESNKGPLFSWSEVTGAASYVIEIRSESGVGNWASITTAATAWATTQTVPDGTWLWRVTAKDANKNVLGTTPFRTFYVDFSRPTVTSRTPTSSGTTRSNFTTTFSEAVRGVSSTTVRLYLGRTRVSARVSYSSSRRQATLNPVGSLKRGRTYTVKVSGSIRDAKGNLVVPKSWTVRIR